MARLEDITVGACLEGILPHQRVTVVATGWHGSTCLELTYRDGDGGVGSLLLYRDNEPSLEVAKAGLPWSFDGDGALLRLASEARRISLAYLFDPLLAVHSSEVDPLPHQLTAVYGEMLPRQPLRYLLADDPGAGKTIMAGLLIKELIARGDVERCLIVCPGMLVEQWQDELDQRFSLPFEILTNDSLEAARTGNWFAETPLAIARLDKLSRNDEVQARLAQTDWDLVIIDEAHKMSAAFFGGEVKATRRYRLGQLLGGLTRHLLLLTATPHNGKEEDFQLFLALLDGDRFEGRFRDGVHVVDTSDLMRRMVKEQLVRFDGRPLFPERLATTVEYQLSPGEARLYQQVTEYVREEFNRADALETGRKGTVGFALTILQRRLASSPEAIYQSLRRRRERLERRLREEQLLARGSAVAQGEAATPALREADDWDDLDDLPAEELEALEERIVDQATAAQTIAELQAEIAILGNLERLALQVRRSGTDRKWEELANLLQGDEMFDSGGSRRKLVIFTEHRDTLRYLAERIGVLLGRPEAIVTIHGAMAREERRKAQEGFTQDKETQVLLATDAAGEGINLQRAHLMVNYDLPWNPNRLEQRFGRIHRIGQTEVCHLWNLVAAETREGDVLGRLLQKLEVEREALGGSVFDVLGNIIQGTELRRLLIEAIRYGELPEVRARLEQVIDQAVDRERLRSLIEERALSHETIDATELQRVREEMERAEARRLQPHYVASFFREAFARLGGTIRQREERRYEITHVPAAVRSRDRAIGRGAAVLKAYERVTFEKQQRFLPGRPEAALLSPGHPLLAAVIDLVLEQHRDLLRQGAVLLDPSDPGCETRALVYLEHRIHDARRDPHGSQRLVSQRLQFVEISEQGAVRAAGPAPYLDYRPLTPSEAAAVMAVATAPWHGAEVEAQAQSFAIEQLVPEHLYEVRGRREALVDKTLAAVRERLTKEISFWDHRANQLELAEQAGKKPRLNSRMARQRADALEVRLQNRLAELASERQLSPLPPLVVGGALIVPQGLLDQVMRPPAAADPAAIAEQSVADKRATELQAMAAVMAAERSLGFEPVDVSADNRGYDIESRRPGASDGMLRFIEVKGRIAGATTVTITRNELLTALNQPEAFILAIVECAPESTRTWYLREPFDQQPGFAEVSATFDLAKLLARAKGPLVAEAP